MHTFLTLPSHALTVGIDEVGLGPWAGPVVAGAMIITPQALPLVAPLGLRDSKKISPLGREKIFAALVQAHNPGVGLDMAVGQASVEEIDTLGLRPATYLAIQRAVAGLTLTPTHGLMDGNHSPSFSFPVQCVVKGDNLFLPIAGASIMAKVTRDRIMAALHEQYPAYGWSTNAGYGTKAHQDALVTHGPTHHHRRSYKPVARLGGAGF